MAQTTRTFRIFVSSTFSDLKEERNALQKYVFPRLRELCTQHGCRFQAIDLRWGVRDEAGLDQQTMKICLDEVARSQDASPRPNFIVLLGDRYGWRPLPAEIPATEFDQINQRVADAGDEDLLDTWYKRDDNARDPVYCLQPREGEFVDFNVWEREVERPLRKVLTSAVGAMHLSDEQRSKYEASATEQEITAGALNERRVPDAAEHVFCFLREISGLPSNQTASDFVDLDENENADAEAGAKLRRLKRWLEERLPGNIVSYSAQWLIDRVSTDHIGILPETLEECLRLIEPLGADVPSAAGLCVDVWRRLARVILNEINRIGSIDALDKEIDDHKRFGEVREKVFIGRASILTTISDYVAGSDRHPLVVWGESGSGKSALIAKAIAECGVRSADCEIISRFIGATPASSDARSLLESLCRQITRAYVGDETTIPTEYRELVKELASRMALATAGKPLVVFLDALDQLSDADHARNLIWLPADLPENVRLVVTTLPGECLTALERKVPTGSIVKLEPMPSSEGRELLDKWLGDAGRTLQDSQRREVLDKFDDCGLPLYLKLAFEEARRWKSYTRETSLSADIPGVIRDLFARLSSESNHGAMMVSRSLSYLAASKNGLTEDELLDVLSRDAEVFDDFKQRAKHTPPEERLPVIVWSRLYFDLEPYLTERSADGAALLGFYHRQLREASEEQYLESDKRARHAHLAEYFSSQDLFEPQKKAPNIRKLSELPYQQTYGEKWDELHATLTDFDFLEAKCTHVAVVTSGKGDDAKTLYGGVYELQEDYVRALENWGGGTGSAHGGSTGRNPLIVTAWVSPVDQSHAVGCPLCRVWSEVSRSALGTEISCPNCVGPLKVNPFTIDSDWRPVAEGWRR